MREVHEAHLSDNKKLLKLGGQEEERTLQANVGCMCRCGEGENEMTVKGPAAREATPKGNITQGLLPGP